MRAYCRHPVQPENVTLVANQRRVLALLKRTWIAKLKQKSQFTVTLRTHYSNPPKDSCSKMHVYHSSDLLTVSGRTYIYIKLVKCAFAGLHLTHRRPPKKHRVVNVSHVVSTIFVKYVDGWSEPGYKTHLFLFREQYLDIISKNMWSESWRKRKITREKAGWKNCVASPIDDGLSMPHLFQYWLPIEIRQRGRH